MTRHLLSVLAGLAAAGLAPTAPPNVVVILADDTGYADLGVHGGADVPTPNIDSLAKNGVRCTNGYVSCPYCSPTRAGLMTGRYQTRFGHEFNEGGAARDVFGLPVTETTFAQRMKALGYATAAVGKWHLGAAPQFKATSRGYDEFYGTVANTPFLNPPNFIDSRKSPDVSPVKDDSFYTTDAYADRAVDIIHKNASKPFYLYLPFNANHVPVQSPDKYKARVKGIADPTRAAYAAMFIAMDDAVGRVLGALRDKKLEENTLVFFLSDNGGPMTKMGPNGSNNGPLKGQKGDTWEGGIRVPFLVQYPGKLPAGAVYDKPVISLDILPTAIAAAGGTVDPAWKLDGVNLLPFLRGENKGTPHDVLFWRFGPQWAVRKGDWKLVRGLDYDVQKDQPSVNDTKVTTARLHNLKDDLGEAKDVAAANAGKAAELQAAYDSWNKEQMAPRWIPMPTKAKK